MARQSLPAPPRRSASGGSGPLLRRRTLLAAGAGAGLGLALAGCSGNGGSGRTPVTVWHGFTEADGAVVQQLADEFNAAQQDFDIQVAVSPWNVITDKLLPAIAAGNGPDLVVQGVDTGLGYVNQGAFVSMQDFYDDPANETETYYEHVVDYAQFDGQMYAVPMAYGPFAIWYNTEIFDQAGVGREDFPATWEEWIDLAEELTVGGSGGDRADVFGLALGDVDANFLPTALQGGGGEVYQNGAVTLDAPENIATMRWWRDAYARGWGPTSVGLPEAIDLFKAGKAAMTMVGPWIITGAESVGLPIDSFEMPAGPAKIATQAAANYWWLTAQADDETRAGAAAFLRYYNSRDSQVRWALGSYYPPNRTDIPAEALAENPHVAKMQAYTENAYIRIAGLPGGLSDVDTVLGSLSVRMTQGSGGDLPPLVANATAQIEEILDRFQ